MRYMTLAWAVALLCEAGVRIVLIPLLPVSAFLVVSEFMLIAVLAGMMAWTLRYGKRRVKLLEPAGKQESAPGNAGEQLSADLPAALPPEALAESVPDVNSPRTV